MSTDVEIPLQLITPDLVRSSIKRARRSLEAAAEEIIWQIEMEAWRTLGYPSWTAMREAEYGGAAFMVPSKNRPELVARIKAVEVGRTARGTPKHLTNQEIAETVGVSERQVRDDLHDNNKSGKTAEFVPPAATEVIDAEIIEDPEEAPTPAPAKPTTTSTCPTCNGTGKVTP